AVEPYGTQHVRERIHAHIVAPKGPLRTSARPSRTRGQAVRTRGQAGDSPRTHGQERRQLRHRAFSTTTSLSSRGHDARPTTLTGDLIMTKQPTPPRTADVDCGDTEGDVQVTARFRSLAPTMFMALRATGRATREFALLAGSLAMLALFATACASNNDPHATSPDRTQATMSVPGDDMSAMHEL